MVRYTEHMCHQNVLFGGYLRTSRYRCEKWKLTGEILGGGIEHMYWWPGGLVEWMKAGRQNKYGHKSPNTSKT